MKNLKYIPVCLLIPIIYLLMSSTGCETTTDPGGGGNDSTQVDSAASVTKFNQAYALLEGEFFYLINHEIKNTNDLDVLNFKTANELFKEAIKLNPNNKQAQYGAALTEILIAYADTAVKRLIKDFETWANSENVSFLNSTILPSSTDKMKLPILPAAFNIFAMHKMAVTDPPLISRVQTVLKNNFLPKITYALEKLALVEADANFKFTVSGKMQGDPALQSVSIYPAEVFLTDAMLQGLKFPIEVFLMYKFELNDYTQQSLVAALQQNSTTFFYLASDGAQRATNAKNALQTMVNKIQSAVTSLENFSGSKPDAVIKLGNNGIKQADLDTLKQYLTKAANSFNQNVSFELKDADSDGNDYTLNVNVGNFFNNPAQNPKQAYLPPYTVTASGTDDIKFDFVAQTYDDFTFPDPTFNGLFPGMTNEILKRILYIDEEYGFVLEGNARYEGGNSGWGWQPIDNATIKIVTASANTYTSTTNSSGEFKIVVRNAPSAGTKINYISFNTGQGEFEISYRGYSSDIYVKSKTQNWCDIIITQPPQNLSASVITNNVFLQWQVNGFSNGNGLYAIDRKIGSGSYSTIDSSNYYNYNFTDYNVTSGISYTYRIRTAIPEFWGGDYYIFFRKESLYSNSVTITP